MTEAIKQLIAYQAKFWLSKFSHSSGKRVGYIMGLTKGIEIAEGFAEFVDDYAYSKHHNRWVQSDKMGFIEFVTASNSFSTSQLLEKYLNDSK